MLSVNDCRCHCFTTSRSYWNLLEASSSFQRRALRGWFRASLESSRYVHGGGRRGRGGSDLSPIDVIAAGGGRVSISTNNRYATIEKDNRIEQQGIFLPSEGIDHFSFLLLLVVLFPLLCLFQFRSTSEVFLPPSGPELSLLIFFFFFFFFVMFDLFMAAFEA